jgi:hypothetical protein
MEHESYSVDKFNTCIQNALYRAFMNILSDQVSVRPECHFPLAELSRKMHEWEVAFEHYQKAILICKPDVAPYERRQRINVAAGIAQYFTQQGWNHIAEGILMSCLSADYELFEPSEERVRLFTLLAKVVPLTVIRWFLETTIMDARSFVSHENIHYVALVEMLAIYYFENGIDCAGAVELMNQCLLRKPNGRADALLFFRSLALDYYAKQNYLQAENILTHCVFLMKMEALDTVPNKETIRTKYHLAVVYGKLQKWMDGIKLLEECIPVIENKKVLNGFMKKEIVKLLKTLKAENVNHRVNSPGGGVVVSTPIVTSMFMESKIKFEDGFDKELLYSLIDFFLGIREDDPPSLHIDASLISMAFSRQVTTNVVEVYPRRYPPSVPQCHGWISWWTEMHEKVAFTLVKETSKVRVKTTISSSSTATTSPIKVKSNPSPSKANMNKKTVQQPMNAKPTKVVVAKSSPKAINR